MENKKVDVYHDLIFPLIQQIDTIAVDNGIPYLLVFQMSENGTIQSHYIPSSANRAMKESSQWWLQDTELGDDR